MRLFSLSLIAALFHTSTAFSLWPSESPPELLFPRAENNTHPAGPNGGGNEQALANSNSTTFTTAFDIPSSNFTFTLSVSPSGNIWFRLAGPRWWSWIAVGTGSEMSGSLMFIVYQNNKNGVTLAPRLAFGNHEPTYSQSNNINLTFISAPPQDVANGFTSDNRFVASGFCFNCSAIVQEKLDVTNTKQPFIYAVGPPSVAPYSSDPNAPLRRHYYYGRFTMDMTQALGDTIPKLGNATSPGVINLSRTRDGNYAESGHGFIMVLAFLIIFPIGIIMVRTLERVKLHLILQSIGLGLVVLGLALGLVISGYYNRSRSFNSAHQIIGLIVMVAIFAQGMIGYLHHRSFVRNQVGKPMLSKVHKLFLGPIAFGLGLANGSIGLRLAMAYTLNWVYIGLVFLVAIILMFTAWKREWFRRRWGVNGGAGGPNAALFGGPAPSAVGAGGAYAVGSSQPQAFQSGGGASYGARSEGLGPYGAHHDHDPFGTRSDIALRNMGDPPAYTAPPTKPREFA